ncbi:MAG: hypothetical protein H7123_09115, partial [Thermoleophilia bacterium]|nr:hypothetical protein [Thermoleophilia bacterium]
AAKASAAVKKAAAKPAGRKSVSAAQKASSGVRKAAAKPAASASSSARKATASAKKAGTTVRKAATTRASASAKSATASARKLTAKRPITKASTKSKTGASSTKLSAKGKSLGEQVYRQVEELVESGKTAKSAFAVVARERKMTVANVQQHYYRFKRKASVSARKAESSVKRVQNRTISRVSKATKDSTKQVRDLGSKLREEDLSQISTDVVKAFNDLLSEARKNPRFRKLEKSFTALLTR